MARTQFSLATFNLYNLSKPGLRMYNNTKGWSKDQYDKKIEWTGRMIAELEADVFGFQELWHYDALAEAFAAGRKKSRYKLLAPKSHKGGKIICAGAVRSDILVGDPQWIECFPENFVLKVENDDPQAPEIEVNLDGFSRPVLHFKVRPRSNGKVIHVFVCHFKSKRPTDIWREGWYEKDIHGKHREAIGAGLSTIRRTAEATALRMVLTDLMKNTDTPVIVLGDLNDGQRSNTLNIVGGQPNYLLSGLSDGGSDIDLYTVGALQQFRSQRDVYYTHVYQNFRESLDHILVSQEFYDNSRKRLWAFKGMEIVNDHLNSRDHKDDGTADHGIPLARFEYRPRKK